MFEGKRKILTLIHGAKNHIPRTSWFSIQWPPKCSAGVVRRAGVTTGNIVMAPVHSMAPTGLPGIMPFPGCLVFT